MLKRATDLIATITVLPVLRFAVSSCERVYAILRNVVQDCFGALRLAMTSLLAVITSAASNLVPVMDGRSGYPPENLTGRLPAIFGKPLLTGGGHFADETKRLPSPYGGNALGRVVRFEGERMVLIPPPRRIGEGEEHREIIWERIAVE
jgi:hypothetical protein